MKTDKILVLALALLSSFIGTSCSDMSDVYKEYLKQGEYVYIGIADSLTILPGNCRAKVRWKLNADPKLQDCVLKWSENDSVVIPIEKVGEQWMETIIADLPEESLLLTAYTRDIYGNISLKTEKSQAIYGPTYISNLSARKITDIEAIDAENLTIKWNSLDNCVGVNLSYTSQTGEQNQYFVAADELETTLYGAQLGSEFSYVTLFRPTENCIDIFETSAPHVMSFPSGYLLDRTGWAATASSDASHKNDGGKAEQLLDDNLDTFWHSSWDPDEPLPHWVLIDMKDEYLITEVTVHKRKDNADCKKIEVYLSMDGNKFEQVGALEYQNTASPNSLTLTLEEPIEAKYLKCVITESYRAPFVSLSEIKVFGRPKK